MGAFGEHLIRAWGGDINHYRGDKPKKKVKRVNTVDYKDVEWTLEKVRETISKSNKGCLKALILIQSYQTSDEQALDQTVHVNGRGWNSTDGDFMSSLAKQYRDTGSLSDTQMEHCKKAIRKYAGQVFKHIEVLAKGAELQEENDALLAYTQCAQIPESELDKAIIRLAEINAEIQKLKQI